LARQSGNGCPKSHNEDRANWPTADDRLRRTRQSSDEQTQDTQQANADADQPHPVLGERVAQKDRHECDGKSSQSAGQAAQDTSKQGSSHVEPEW
jgi:hypothetical protein